MIPFQVLRQQQPAVAPGYVGVRIFESTIIAAGNGLPLAIVTLREGSAGTAAADAASLRGIGSALVEVRDWTFFFGPACAPASAARCC